MNALGILALAGCCTLGGTQPLESTHGEAPVASPALRERAVDQAEELGRVRWRRDHDAAFGEARSANKPLLLLFQEIPG